MNKLPTEILSLIISTFDGKKDREILKNLCLSSSLFLKPSQSILFHHLHIGPVHSSTIEEVKSDYGQKLFNLLQNSPHIIPYVREVTISDFLQALMHSEWLIKGLKLAAALDKLQVERLESFSFQRHHQAKWHLICPEVREAVMTLCKAPSLERLSIRTAPLALVGLCAPSLKHLESTNAEVVEDDRIPGSGRSSGPVLETLQLMHAHDLDRNAQYLLDPTSQLDLSNLRTLNVTAFIPSDHRAASSLLKSCQGTLRSFHFQPTVDIMTDLPVGQVSLVTCNALSHLEISLDTTAFNGLRKREALGWLAESIDSHISLDGNVIETLRLNLQFDLFDGFGDLRGATGNMIHHYVSRIGLALSSARRFPKLCDVQVAIKSSNSFEDDGEEIREFIWDALGTALRERNILTVIAFPHYLFSQEHRTIYG